MDSRLKTRLVLAGLLAGSLALGAGCKPANAEANPQDLLQQQQQEDETANENTGTTLDETQRRNETQGTLDEPGTGGAGDAGTAPRQGETLEEPGTGGTLDDPFDQHGTGGAGTQGTMEEPGMGTGGSGTGGTGDTWNEELRDEDEGVLQPGVNDEGLDTQDPTLAPDSNRQQGRGDQPED
jgi:hypothetical protein